MSLKIKRAGTLSLLQDLGRNGFQDIGVTPGGPMDAHAFHWANRLLDNHPHAAQIEITMGPFEAIFEKPTSFALCGAQVNAKLNGKEISTWQSWQADHGHKLEVGYPRRGLRSYLAVKDGFKAPQILGSVSTVLREQIGGLRTQGDKLINGDLVPYDSHVQSIRRIVPKQFVPEFTDVVRIGVLPTYQFYQFSASVRDSFFSQYFEVTAQIDRMGYRLKGEPIPFSCQDFISEGIALGAIQIPANGQPIVLMRDRQTIGGYPKMGCVCQQDLNKLAQCVPGSRVQFYIKNIFEAAEELQLEQNYFFSSVFEHNT